jgi:arylsulfatase A-like enzyme
MTNERPNILLIYTDQQRHDTISALGNDHIRTPYLDRMVEDGVSFTRCTTPCPVCMPARWSLHTGQYPTTHGCYSNHDAGPYPKHHLPGLLREAGYRTALVGKNHTFLGPKDFDLFAEDPQGPEGSHLAERKQWVKEKGEQYVRLAEEPVAGGVQADPGHIKTDCAIDFMKERSDQPFFVWLSYAHPHTPYWVPEPFFGMYEDAELPPPHVEPEGLRHARKPFRQRFHQRNNDAILPFSSEQIETMRRVYYGQISLVDAEVGRLLSFLDRRGIARDTLVVFTSDHGDYQGDHGLLTKSPALYDCLVRVPMICRWPGAIDAGRRDPRFVSHIDLLPTFCELAEAEVPDSVQGFSMLESLRDGGEGYPVRRAAFSEYGVPGPPYNERRLREEGLADKRFSSPFNQALPWEGNPVSLAGRIYMVRTREWKFVWEPGGRNELYDLLKDPYELTNLAGLPALSAVESSLQATLREWLSNMPEARK